MRIYAAAGTLIALLAGTCWPAGLEVRVGRGRGGAAQARPGETLRVEVSSAAGSAEVFCVFRSSHFPFYPRPDGRLRALIGLTADVPPGDYPLTVTRRRPPEADETASMTVRVLPRRFSSQSLRVSKELTERTSDPDSEQALSLIRAALRRETPDQRWKGTFRLPAKGRLSSRYGHARMVNKDLVWSWHKGVDIAAPLGRPVRAPNDGTVVLAGEYPLQGRTLVLDHGQGVMSALMHLQELKAQAGQAVSKGSAVATVGSTGFSTGAHLHWGVYVHGDPVDPLDWTRRRY